ncbi:MAG: 2,3-bisphosphoglycerate-dependent phosphoglycerate mutase [Pseudomonadota bacterium]|nr:2,3-bisphosphoglycerate-dependent phosphoglycerate mutase [Pseudomonadota bacterium]MED5436674.1 2,3-bisphosphoglycerate-dependent phosphoglycerate mutase [Pseudomonadota bacterium]
MKLSVLSLVRHGQSEWNEKNLFTGWENPGLTIKGKEEAKYAGSILSELNITYDCFYTSVLDRAILTAEIIINVMGIKDFDLIKAKDLNERDYGDLTGLNKDDARKKWGDDQVHTWRRSFDTKPPNGESLKDTADRVIPYYQAEILTKLKEDKNILISAHGNSLRALIMHIEKLSPNEILKREIGTGKPIVYNFNVSKETFSLEHE